MLYSEKLHYTQEYSNGIEPGPALSENNSVQVSFHLYLCLKQPFTYFSPIFHFYSPWKRLKTFDFLTFSGGIENGALG